MKKRINHFYYSSFYWYSDNKPLIIKKNCFYFLFFKLSSYYCGSYINNLHVIINPNLNNITYQFFYKNFSHYIFFKKWNFFLKFIFKYTFKKIKFTGKGYYLYKNKRNSLALQFNYSHKVNLYFYSLKIIKYSKRSWLFFNLNSRHLLFLLKFFKKIRPINVFTLRGIRFTKQLVYQKKKK